MDAADSTWTIFFHGQFRLYIEGTTVEISEYISSTSKLVYEAGDPGRPGFSLYAHGSWCAATTELIGTEIPDIRIWRGDVDWLYRNDPQNSRYALYENDLVYQIARIEEDDAVGYIDFHSVHHRNNRPILDVGAQAVWPVNVDMVKRDSLEVLGQVPADDRPYLLDVICQAAECPDFVQDIELYGQLARNFQEEEVLQSPTVKTVRSVQEEDVPQGSTATEEIVQGEQGTQGSTKATKDIVQEEEETQGPKATKEIVQDVREEQVTPKPTTTIIYARSTPTVTEPTKEFVTQEPEPLISARSHTTGHTSNSCGTGPMPANSPANCANSYAGLLGCDFYYRCEEYDDSSDGCGRWSGPYGSGGAGMTFCASDGTEWDDLASYGDAIASGDHTTSAELKVYCANLDDWIDHCDTAGVTCGTGLADRRTNIKSAIRDDCNQERFRQQGESKADCRARRYEEMDPRHCGHLPRPAGWTADWPPAGFTKQ